MTTIIYTTIVSILVVSLIFSISYALFEGDNCVMIEPDIRAGKCISITKCDYAQQRLQEKKISPQNCGFIGQTPLVCCPKSPIRVLSKSSRSEEKCREYHHIRNQRPGIAFGLSARPKEFPHMAAVGYGSNKSNILWLCGGSLISDRFVLTAAHCTQTREYGDPKWVRLGDLNLNDTKDDAEPQDINVDTVFVHPDYKPPSHYNDIALIKLKVSARFGTYVAPACIYTKKLLPPGRLQAIGWGKTDFFADSNSPQLMKVFLNIIGHEKCAKIYLSAVGRRLPKGILDESHICAGDVSGKDTCPGDSGGPLQILDSGSSDVLSHYVVVGVTSFGKGCGFENSAGVYTRVSTYQSWIESTVWPLK